MKNIIQLWEDGLLPIKDAIYFSNGESFLCKITSYPTPCIEKNGEFDFSAFYEKNKDEVTDIDKSREVKLANNCYCCIGEGSYGSEGFIAYLDENKNLVWVLYSEESNPFINITEYTSDIIIVESSSNIRLRININNPVDLELAF
ncbi:hypothetical protein KV337_004988 [Escherichia coli]|uniref:Uncharacterized protein n=1 Tax=Escherichia coli TaxID=562 RepID=A0AAI9BBX4_ECOLX|nr:MULTISPECIES: hypothetical protein [Escherichia]EFN6915457.1 hypothetical protein [Escherichia coli O10]HDQ6537088.1 hypothetical protein [Escherichia coli O36:H14]ANO87882.1 hypothetical protein GJ11_03805 [Escherichia coli]EFC0651767.1 hypothetical protein [Escherichia coli]EFI6955418.1 hypothetical protein [Escherichia coli]